MKCVHTFGTGRHKRQADITLLFQYITLSVDLGIVWYLNVLIPDPCCLSLPNERWFKLLGFTI